LTLKVQREMKKRDRRDEKGRRLAARLARKMGTAPVRQPEPSP
jgi:hypothetical protein